MTLMLAVVMILVGAIIIQSAIHTWTSERSETRETLAALRWWMLPAAIGMLVVVASTYWLLKDVPILSWGWYQMVSGEPGNAIAGQSDKGGAFAALGILIPLAFAFAVPREALAEESAFRYGNHERTLAQRAKRCVAFGLIHCAVGVPLAAGVALIISGVFYDLVYQHATTRAARRHREIAATEVAATARVAIEDDPWTPVWHSEEHIMLRAGLSGCTTAAAAHATANWVVLTVLLLGITFDTLL